MGAPNASCRVPPGGERAGCARGVLTGRATAHRASISTSKSYGVQRDAVFESKVFAELPNAQAIVLAYDGLGPWPPTYCYLKPHYLPRTGPLSSRRRPEGVTRMSFEIIPAVSPPHRAHASRTPT